MGNEIITFGFIEIEKDVDNDNILISYKTSSGDKNNKYFISYMDDYYKIKPLFIMLLKMTEYVKSYDGETK